MSTSMRIGVAGAGPEQLRHFLAVMARRDAPVISVEDAMGTLAVVEAVREAARSGTAISPNQLVEQAA